MPREILLMCLRHLVPVVADVTVGFCHHVWCSHVSQKAAACWETLHRPGRAGGRGMSLCTCVMLGGTDSASYQTASLPCPTTTGQQRLPKPKLYFPEMRQRQLKLAQSDWEIVQNTVGHVRTVQRCDSKWCLSCFRCVGARQIQLALPSVERATTLCDRLIHKVWDFVNFKGEIRDIRWRQQRWRRAAVYWDVNWLVRGWRTASDGGARRCKETGRKHFTDSLSPFHTFSLLY